MKNNKREDIKNWMEEVEIKDRQLFLPFLGGQDDVEGRNSCLRLESVRKKRLLQR